MRSHRITAWSAITVLAVAGCTSGGGDDGAGGAAAAPPMTDVTAESEEAGTGVTLSWPEVEGAAVYRVGADHAVTDVPDSVCGGGTCELTVDAAMADADGGLPLRVVTDDGAVSDPVVTDVDVSPAPAPGPEDAADGPLDVVRVTPTDAAPEVEVLSADSVEEAERLVEETPPAADAAVNSPVLPQTTGLPRSPALPRTTGLPGAVVAADAEEEPELLATWSTEALRHDLLPGDPPGDGVVVAVVEAGVVDASHPALQGVVADALHVGDAAAGVVGPDNHATAAASLVAGQAEGGVPGTAPGATILPVALGDEPTAADLMDGILLAVDEGADIINVSAADLACDSPDPASCDNLAAFESVVAYAAEQDALVVAAAGNNGPGELSPGVPCTDEEYVNHARLPASLDSVVTVGAHTSDGEQWACTPERSDVDILAPGRNLLVAQRGGGYAVESGTSLAAPAFVGVLAALKSEHPWLNSEAVRQRLPQWAGPGQRLDPVAALVDIGFLDPDDAHETPEGVAAVHPYEFGFAFEPGHPVHDAVDEAALSPDVMVENVWQQHPYVLSSSRKVRTFGLVTGVIYLYEDGTAEATATWDHRSLRAYLTGPNGLARYVTGWTARCDYQHSRADLGLPGARSVAWDLDVDMTVTPTGEEDGRGWPTADVEVELAGPPEPTVTYDTWDECPGQIQTTVDHVTRNVTVPFAEQDTQVERFFELGQQAHEDALGTYRFDAVPIGSDATIINHDEVDQPWVRSGFNFDFAP